MLGFPAPFFLKPIHFSSSFSWFFSNHLSTNHLRFNGMLVMCGQRGGLIANLTRLIHFGPPAKELMAKHETVCKVEAALWEATKPGAKWGDALKAGITAYKNVGHAKEWELHHQGGPTGYSGRDFIVTPDEKRTVLDKHTTTS